MKICNVAVAAGLLAAFIPALAQNPEGVANTSVLGQTTVDAVKLKELNLRRESLQKRIETEDAKRNRHIDGVSAQVQEAADDRQDSLCLALRSQLVDAELELRELSADDSRPAIVDRVGQIGRQL